MRRPFDAILFDLDGTLADSADDIAVALGAAFNALGLTPARPVASLVDGAPLEEIFALAAPDGDAALFDRFTRIYRAVYLASGHQRTRLYPGVAETLGALRALRPPVRLAIATSKRSQTARHLAETFGIAAHFEHIEGSGAVSMRPKPAPDLLLHLARRMDLPPARALMVGDTARDIAAGRAAGMRTAAVLYGLGSRDALAKARPDHMLEDIEDVLALLHDGARG